MVDSKEDDDSKAIVQFTYATRESGMGHLYRSLLLSAEVIRPLIPNAPLIVMGDDKTALFLDERAGGNIHFISEEAKEEELIAFLHSFPTELLFCDLPTAFYKESCRLFARLAPSTKLLFLDNSTPTVRFADILINILPYPAKYKLPKLQKTELYEGFEYYPLGSRWDRIVDSNKKQRKTAKYIVISMGGSDPADLTEFALEALRLIKTPVGITVVLGPGFCSPGRFSESVATFPHPVKVLWNTNDLPRIISDADIVLTAAPSLTLYECASARTPAIGIAPFDFHHLIAEGFAKKGSMVYMGPKKKIDLSKLAREVRDLLEDRDKREDLAEAGGRLIDGKGIERIRQILQSALP